MIKRDNAWYKRARPNKLAQGMSKTFDRSRQWCMKALNSFHYRRQIHLRSREVLRLMVYGTNDVLTPTRFRMLVTKVGDCKHCGKFALNDRGRARLKILRKRFTDRQTIKKYGSQCPLLKGKILNVRA